MGKKLVAYVSGCWDIFHIGHLRRIERAKELCDFLVVGVNTDRYISSYKPRPTIPYSQRAAIVGALSCVDAVVPHDSAEDICGFDEYEVSMRIVGPEYKETVGEEVANRAKERVKLIIQSRTPNISTREIKEKIRSENQNAVSSRCCPSACSD